MKKAVLISVLALAFGCKHEESVTQTQSSTQLASQKASENFSEENSNLAQATVISIKGKAPIPNSFFESGCDTSRLSAQAPDNNSYLEVQSPAEYLASRYVPRQTFEINPGDFNTIVGVNGTMLQFPPAAFMINDTTAFQGTVKVELREVLSKSQMVFANFSTTSNGTPLESAGMIYWNATTADGQQLHLDSGAFVSVTFPGRLNAKDYQLFTGNVTDGMMNWSLYPTLKISSALLPIAVISHDYFRFSSYRIPRKILKHDKKLDGGWNDQIMALANGRYANTQLSTKEFLRRLERIKWMGWNSELLEIYMDSPNDLHRGDSLAMIQIAVYASNIKKSSFLTSKKYLAIGASKKRWVQENTTAFRIFYEESRCYDQEIFVNAKVLRWRWLTQLENKGIDRSYAQWLMRPYIRHKQIGIGYSIIDDPRDLNSYSYASASNTRRINLRVPSMGYINCDRFINTSKKEDVLVEIENYNEMESISSMLILKSINSVMSGYGANGLFTFKDVPSDYKTYWVIIGSCEGQLYYVSQEVSPNPSPQGIVKALLKATTVKELEKIIKSFSI